MDTQSQSIFKTRDFRGVYKKVALELIPDQTEWQSSKKSQILLLFLKDDQQHIEMVSKKNNIELLHFRQMKITSHTQKTSLESQNAINPFPPHLLPDPLSSTSMLFFDVETIRLYILKNIHSNTLPNICSLYIA